MFIGRAIMGREIEDSQSRKRVRNGRFSQTKSWGNAVQKGWTRGNC